MTDGALQLPAQLVREERAGRAHSPLRAPQIVVIISANCGASGAPCIHKLWGEGYKECDGLGVQRRHSCPHERKHYWRERQVPRVEALKSRTSSTPQKLNAKIAPFKPAPAHFRHGE